MWNFIKECLSYKGRWNRQKFWLYPLGFVLILLLPLIIIFLVNIIIAYLTGINSANAISFGGDLQPTEVEMNTIKKQGIVENTSSLIYTIYFLIFYILLLYVSIVAYIKRLHDLNKTGWMSLLMFVPLANIYLLIISGFFKGTTGPNRFGPDPLNPNLTGKTEVNKTTEL